MSGQESPAKRPNGWRLPVDYCKLILPLDVNGYRNGQLEESTGYI